MTGPREDWDEARLDAAFAARAAAAPPTPVDLVGATLDRMNVRRRIWGGRSRASLAAAAAIVLLFGLVGVRTLAPPLPAAASGVPSPGPRSTAHSQPSDDIGARLGEPITVSEALAARVTADDRELVVAGFLSPSPILPCPFVPAKANPTLINCPASFQWLMERPEVLLSTGPGSANGGPPSGPAFHPSFALVEPPDVPIPATGGALPRSVALAGHFHDRRAALCPVDPEPAIPCGDAFVVDRVLAVDGAPSGVVTRLRNQRFDDATQQQVTVKPRDLEEDVDLLVLGAAPGSAILSRQLVTIGQVLGIEPVLAKDGFVPNVGNPATLVWIVTVLDQRNGIPIARTFALFDGSNWFAEVTAGGAIMHDRLAATGSTGVHLPVPSGDPTAFDTAPTSVLGIQVRDVATVMRDRQAVMDDLGRDEMAIRAWYVGPNPAVGCEPAVAPIHSPTPPCDKARQWLLDRPEQFGAEIGQLRTNPEHWPPVLNPLLPVDVPFDVPASWAGDVPTPQPVVVLGHFEDNRVATYAGNVYFVLDALAWTKDRPLGTLDSQTRLTSAATEDPASVLARVGKVSPNDAVANWTTVVDAADFASLDPRTATDAPEFTSGAPVWIVRRLVHNEVDGRQRLAVEWAYTADHGTRVWWTEMPDSPADLATSIDVRHPDPQTTVVRVFDYAQQIRSVHSAAGLGSLAWRHVGPDLQTGLQVARGQSSDREVAIRWTGGACGSAWQIRVYRDLDGQIRIEPSISGDPCGTRKIVRQILLTFDVPIDLDRIRTGDPCCG